MIGDAPPPRWDGQRLLFNLAVEGGGTVRCAISRLALLSISGSRWLHGPQLFRQFTAMRPRIEAAARAKLRARSSPPLGILHIWEEDVIEPPPDSSPCAMAGSDGGG